MLTVTAVTSQTQNRARILFMKKIISKDKLTQQLINLGVKADGVLLVHTSFSKVRPVENNMLGLIDVLQTVVTPEGTLVMPSMTWDDENIFNPQVTPCPEMGIVADTFWRQPHTLRSDNAHAFAATGKYAELITASHPIDLPHGVNSPVGRIYELDGQILLLGVGQDANTTIHLAENLAGVRYRHQSRLKILQDGKPVWFDFEEVNHCCQNFKKVDTWLEQKNLLRKGIVGHAEARLMNSRDIVRIVMEKLKMNETIFLHPYGFDEECDMAHDSIPD